MYGYNEVPTTLPVIRMAQGGRTERQQFDENVKSLLCGMGLWEAETFSFISPRAYDAIRLATDDKKRNSVVISNPLGEDTSVMRTTALPSMLDVLAHNKNHKNPQAAMYELATVYIPTSPDTLPDERHVLALGMYDFCDFYTLKGIVERVLSMARVTGYKFATVTNDPSYHPGRCAAVVRDGETLAVLGQIHPDTTAAYGLSGEVLAAEIDIDRVFELRDTHLEFRHLPRYPSIARDFSFVCDESLEAGSIEDVCIKTGGKLVESAVVFDVYRGIQVGAGKKSVSIRVTLRAEDRTLTDEEADKIAQKMLRALSETMGVVLRDK